MEFIVHCSSPLNNEQHFCRMIFLLSLKLCQNCFKPFKLIDLFLYWTNCMGDTNAVPILTPSLHLYLALYQVTSVFSLHWIRTVKYARNSQAFKIALEFWCKNQEFKKLFLFSSSGFSSSCQKGLWVCWYIWRFQHYIIKCNTWKITKI